VAPVIGAKGSVLSRSLFVLRGIVLFLANFAGEADRENIATNPAAQKESKSLEGFPP
jgi:hypothetical protein